MRRSSEYQPQPNIEKQVYLQKELLMAKDVNLS